MLKISGFNHVGIRVGEKNRSIKFYRALGFEVILDAGFDDGHPIILRHPGGVVLNLIGPAVKNDVNVLMDAADKPCGFTHIALTVDSLEEAAQALETLPVAITGSFSFENMRAIFIRDPDGNVIELDAYKNLAERTLA